MRWQIWKIIEPGTGAWGRFASAFLIVLILANVGVEIATTLPDLTEDWQRELHLFDSVAVAVFALEYLLRLWVCVEDPRERFHHHPVAGRLRYMVTPKALIDLAAILPLFLGVILSPDMLRFLRLARLLKLLRYSAALDTLGDVVKAERRVLISAGIVMLVLLVTMSSFMYYLEREVQPQVFGSIPAAMWWGVVTLATVGYGDVVPHTPLGKLMGGVSAVMGLCMFALPAGILASAFSQEMKKRDFVITWTMVSKVPLFSGLNASIIADIAGLFAPKVAVPGERLVRKGDPADAMFLIVSGEVEVDVGDMPKRLKTGDFFGEIALLEKTTRTATVRAVSTCQLLALEVDDFERLLDSHPELKDTIRKVAVQRLSEIERIEG
ncbi:MAG: cyclic nucleotide-gated ion channel/potassium channel family protein [Rhodospirillales bacterium]|nr:cyclic nucleotide-gated ion channel/potassium channel family protein [Rhodospirillales bacterium]